MCWQLWKFQSGCCEMIDLTINLTNLELTMNIMTHSYLQAALWTEGLDDELSVEDFDSASIALAELICDVFAAVFDAVIDGREDEAGHDLWLTQNRHGAGFRDGDWEDCHPKLLTAFAVQLGDADVVLVEDIASRSPELSYNHRLLYFALLRHCQDLCRLDRVTPYEIVHDKLVDDGHERLAELLRQCAEVGINN